MTQIDDDAVELTYQEYVEEAKLLKDEGWENFKVYEPRAGVVYVKAFNRVLGASRLITKVEYLSLRDSGLWAKGVDRLKGQVVKTPKVTAAVDQKKLREWENIKHQLIMAHKYCKDYDSLSKALKSAIESMVNL